MKSNAVLAIVPYEDDALRPPTLLGRIGRFFGVKRHRSVLEAQAHHRPTKETGVFSHHRTVIRDIDGNVKWEGEYRHNLTTDTAAGYTNRRDGQAKMMGGGFAPFATAVGAATATGATSLTNAGAAFPTAGQGLKGAIVVASANNAGAGVTVFGMITANTATVLTVDQWYTCSTFALGTTPNATASYCLIPTQLAAMWIAVTSDATSPSSADTTLTSEATTNGFQRALATYAHTAAASTYTQQIVITATGSLTINRYCVAASAVALTGWMPFESAEPSPPVMISGDTCTETITITIN